MKDFSGDGYVYFGPIFFLLPLQFKKLTFKFPFLTCGKNQETVPQFLNQVVNHFCYTTIMCSMVIKGNMDIIVIKYSSGWMNGCKNRSMESLN